MGINKPMLPPRAGYVEVIDENGNHVYKPTLETAEKLKLQAQIEAISQASETAVYDEMGAAYQEGVEEA